MTKHAKEHGQTPALVLTLGGAPNTPHFVTGLPGFYLPDQPMPVGGPDEATVEAAKAADADPNVPVKLVKLPARDVEPAREAQKAYRTGSVSALRRVVRSGATPQELAQVNDEAAAAAPKEA